MIAGKTTKLKEDLRVYVFPNQQFVVLANVTELIVRPSGSHRLKTKDGFMHIIPTGWLHIIIKSPRGWVV